jgi:4-diphosphocytidyl-2-C-methyl-D-erythritol kinase
MKKTLNLLSPAKVNLRLEVLKRREDGYHEIRTLFQKIDLNDRILLSLKEEKGIQITTNHSGLPVDQGNLVFKASQVLIRRSGYPGGISIHIDKRIPLGAGLGGGSSNAAVTLKGLNELLGMGLSCEEMKAMGLQVGADVPFFFLEGAAMGTGIGERLKEVLLPPLWYVLIYPNFEVSTRWAYQNVRLTKKKYRLKIQEFLTTPEGISRILLNDLEEVVSRTFPQIDLMKKILISEGALGSLMTGSGPTVFGIFPEREDAVRAYRKVKRRKEARGWTILRARSLP